MQLRKVCSQTGVCLHVSILCVTELAKFAESSGSVHTEKQRFTKLINLSGCIVLSDKDVFSEEKIQQQKKGKSDKTLNLFTQGWRTKKAHQ